MVDCEHRRLNGIKLLFKFPTRGRPIWFLSTLHKWINELSNECDCDFIIAIDEDDETMNNAKMKALIRQIAEYSSCVNIYIQCRIHEGCVEAVNADLEKRDWDIIMTVSDDLIPLETAYDKMIVEDYLERYPELDGIIYYDDCKHKTSILTFPIIGRSFFDQRGCLLDPAFKYQGADRDLHYIASGMGKLSFVKGKYPYKHEYKKYGTDDTHKRSFNARMEDKNLIQRREREGYYGELQCPTLT